jgi:hypothetical protein
MILICLGTNGGADVTNRIGLGVDDGFVIDKRITRGVISFVV